MRKSPRPRRRYVRFTRWRRRRFFALLEKGGNVRMACELAGVGLGCVYRLRGDGAGGGGGGCVYRRRGTERVFVGLGAAAKKRGVGRGGGDPPADSAGDGGDLA